MNIKYFILIGVVGASLLGANLLHVFSPMAITPRFFALVLFPEVFRDLGSSRILVFAIVMLVIMLYRPKGIWPEKKS